MKIKTLTLALAVMAAMAPSVASAFCPADGHRQSASCKAGTTWDTTLQTCVPDSTA